MNRRDFLKVVTSAAAVMAVPSLIPADARLVLDANNEKVIGEITRDITYHPDRSAYLVTHKGQVNNIGHYCFSYENETDEETLRLCDVNAMESFKRQAARPQVTTGLSNALQNPSL